MQKERDIIRDIESGMFIVSTENSACVVDTVLQVSAGSDPYISVCVNKNNYTNEMIKKNKKFIISILDNSIDGNIIKTFGFNSSRDIDKFLEINYEVIDNIKVLADSLGYMVCELTDIINTETHNIFIGKVISRKRYKNGIPMTYRYYQEHKDELLKVKTEKGKTAWVCTICGYVYYGDYLPDDFTCPVCGYDKLAFEKKV